MLDSTGLDIRKLRRCIAKSFRSRCYLLNKYYTLIAISVYTIHGYRNIYFTSNIVAAMIFLTLICYQMSINVQTEWRRRLYSGLSDFHGSKTWETSAREWINLNYRKSYKVINPLAATAITTKGQEKRSVSSSRDCFTTVMYLFT